MQGPHKAGDKLYVDFAGEKLNYTDKDTGEVIAVEVFVAILGVSQLSYVEAVMSQQKEDFRMKIMLFDSNKDLPLKTINTILQQAVQTSTKIPDCEICDYHYSSGAQFDYLYYTIYQSIRRWFDMRNQNSFPVIIFFVILGSGIVWARMAYDASNVATSTIIIVSAFVVALLISIAIKIANKGDEYALRRFETKLHYCNCT
jgi:hypothetical protein